MEQEPKTRKAINQKHYQKNKKNTDAVLLRLPKGGKDQIDSTAKAFSVARPALFDLYLIPFLGVIASHQKDLAELAKKSGHSIPRLIEQLIARALEEDGRPSPVEVPTEVGSDFDALFGVSTEGGPPSEQGGH